jgi:hypothetical protein
VQILLELNSTTVACPVYVQWSAGDVLTCRASARKFVGRVGAARPGAVVGWEEIEDELEGAAASTGACYSLS